MKRIIDHTKRIAENTLHDLRQQPRRKKERTALSISAGITGIIALVWMSNTVSNLPDFSKSAASIQLLQEELLSSANTATVSSFDEYGNPTEGTDTSSSVPIDDSSEGTGYTPEKEVTTLAGETVIVPASDGSIELRDKNQPKEEEE